MKKIIAFVMALALTINLSATVFADEIIIDETIPGVEQKQEMQDDISDEFVAIEDETDDKKAEKESESTENFCTEKESEDIELSIVEAITEVETNVNGTSDIGNLIEEGDCSASEEDKVMWQVYDTDNDGTADTLLVTGVGSIANYSMYTMNMPWYRYNSVIEKIIVSEGIKRIGEDAFSYCNVRNVELPDTLEEIGAGAFYSSMILNVSFPESLRIIDRGAFYGCDLLENVFIPINVKYIEIAFGDCTSLKAISVDPKNEYYCSADGVLFNKDMSELVQYPCGRGGSYAVPESVQLISQAAFRYSMNLSYVELPVNVLFICDEAFGYCYSLKEVTIQNGDISIWGNAFCYCSNELVFRAHRDTSAIAYAKLNVFRYEEVEHNWDTGYIVKESSCTERGEKCYTCTVCGRTLIEKLVLADHVWNKDYTVDLSPTCVEPGSQSIHCSICNAIKEGSTQEIQATGSHSWNEEYTIDQAETCTESGKRSIHCKICDAVKEGSEQTIPATGHYWNTEMVIKERTCTDFGLILCTCITCNKSEFLTLPAKGHQWNNYYTVDREETCTESGSQSIHCSVCGATDEESILEIQPQGHFWYVSKVVKNSTCTEKGLNFVECLRCEESYYETTPLAEHSWNDYYTIDKEPTCTENGKRSLYCKLCGGIKKDSTEEIPATGHKWNKKYTIDKKETCTDKGRKSFRCNICNAVKTGSVRVIAATGHNWSNWKTIVRATVLKTGKQSRVCARCKRKEERIIRKLQPKGELNEKQILLNEKQTFDFKITGMMAGDYVKTWSSSNRKLATVNKNGHVIAKKKGTLNITATLASGKKLTAKVVVQTGLVRTVKISGLSSTVHLKKGARQILKPVLTPITSQEKITYKSSNEKIAVVSGNGLINAKAIGKAKIIVSSGKIKFIMTVIVSK